MTFFSISTFSTSIFSILAEIRSEKFFRMGKTKAQRQKEYRERLKEKNNEKYLMDSRERQKRNYISVKNMGKAEIEKRRAAVRERVRSRKSREQNNYEFNLKCIFTKSLGILLRGTQDPFKGLL